VIADYPRVAEKTRCGIDVRFNQFRGRLPSRSAECAKLVLSHRALNILAKPLAAVPKNGRANAESWTKN
jgi:hypothetical protein